MTYYQFDGKRIKLKNISGDKPLVPLGAVTNAKPIGTTFYLKNGSEIDVEVLQKDLHKHIIGRNWR